MSTNMNEKEDWYLAREGIKLLLNNKIEEAEQLFSERKENIQMAAGYCFVTFMNALMTFEEEKLEEALQTLRDMEKRCAQDIGWLKSMKNRVFGSFGFGEPDCAEKLEEQIILADSQVCVALLTFLQQDLSSYVKGGWVLRKAWKVYQHTYSQILNLYKKTFGCDAVVPGSQFPSWQVVTRSISNSSNLQLPVTPTSDWSVPNSPAQSVSEYTPTSNNYRNPFSYLASLAFSTTHNEPTIKPEVVARLMSAVSFGYGIFQLCISLLPPSLLKLIHFLGFEGDRKIGVSALMFSKEGNDMRAPLASLSLLWYHTIVRPFFALDGSNVQAGVDAAQNLIYESQEEFGESALFLFFKGRVQRLKCNIPKALEAYEAAIERSPQREVQLLCLHEVGWCYLIQLDWANAYQCFNQLKNKSRWSKSFYTYLTVVCIGAYGDLEDAFRIAEEIPYTCYPVPGNQGRNTTPLEVFISRRIRKFPINKSNVSTPENLEIKSNDEDTSKSSSSSSSDRRLSSENSSESSSLSKSIEKNGNVVIDQVCCKLLAFELLYLWNALPSCGPRQLLDILEDCKTSENEPMIGLCNLIEAAVHTCSRDNESAVSSFKACLDKRRKLENDSESVIRDNLDDNDYHISAFALFEWAMILIQNPQTIEEGKSLLVEAQNNYKGYDFENRLNIRIHSALRKLG